jgi:phage terminase large subunit GpA-like protein
MRMPQKKRKPATKTSSRKKTTGKAKTATKAKPSGKAKGTAKRRKKNPALVDPEYVRMRKVVSSVAKVFKTAERITVSEWADRKRTLPESSAEPGRWRTSRTPYLKEPMDCFTDPKVHKIVMVAASQVGKTEFELNAIGYIIDQDPGTILYIHPSLDEARKFSKQRLDPMIRCCKAIRGKISETRVKDSTSTILQKSFPGGSITLIGSNTPRALASTPVRYVIGDEHDRWAKSAGSEGDPWELAERRQTTFYNRKAIDISTPTIKGASPIEESFYTGTQERWCHLCPECGEYTEIDFDDIKFTHTMEVIHGKETYEVDQPINWCCPKCGCLIPEETMRQQPAKWIAANPKAYDNGVRSFWLNAFSSPWTPWKKICQSFLESRKDALKLKVVWNTLLGKLWEERGDLADEDTMLSRREDYGLNDEGGPVELPDGVLVLTMGVDTQDNRFEYEVVGHGQYGETWGIRYGHIDGRPDVAETWARLDEVIDKVYRFKNGRGLKISITMIDSGGHFTQEVYEGCKARQGKRVFAIKGKGGDGIPFTAPPSKVPIKENKKNTCWLYTIGVDSGKASIMANLKVEEAGAKYCHFPKTEGAGYDQRYFNGLLSEHMILSSTRGVSRWTWEKLPGHQRNEPFDIRNYANAGLRIINPDMDKLEAKLRELNGQPVTKQPERKVAPVQQKRRGAKRSNKSHMDEW